ncbi:unnamed protein product [Closterium sp. Naga37s-1]|nr:unnamed protein product [Closterium sp. Naga37s-1]
MAPPLPQLPYPAESHSPPRRRREDPSAARVAALCPPSPFPHPWNLPPVAPPSATHSPRLPVLPRAHSPVPSPPRIPPPHPPTRASPLPRPPTRIPPSPRPPTRIPPSPRPPTRIPPFPHRQAALGVLLLSVPVVPALPRCQWSAPLYFGLLALWAVYVGSHRSLTRPPVQAVSMQQGMAVPVLCSITLFSLYCLLRFAPDLDLRVLFSSYLTLVGGVAVASHLADPLKAALPKEINDRLSVTLDIPSWLLESSTPSSPPSSPSSSSSSSPSPTPSSSSPSSSTPSSSPSPTPSAAAPAVLTLSATDVLSAALGMAMAVASMQPSAPFSLGNIVAVCIVSEVLQMLSLRSFAVASAVLVGLLLYDVFWVFGSSPIFGDNVMVTVATSDALVGPMKLVFPRWTVDAASPYSILGLGDVAAPGLLMALMLRFDSHRSSSSAAAAAASAADTPTKDSTAQGEASSSSSKGAEGKQQGMVVAAVGDGAAGLEDKTYFLVSVASYLAGLAITIGVNTVTGAAQPALLYLVPSLLLGVSAAAAARSELDVLLRFDDTAAGGAGGDGMEGGLLFKPVPVQREGLTCVTNPLPLFHVPPAVFIPPLPHFPTLPSPTLPPISSPTFPPSPSPSSPLHPPPLPPFTLPLSAHRCSGPRAPAASAHPPSGSAFLISSTPDRLLLCPHFPPFPPTPHPPPPLPFFPLSAASPPPPPVPRGTISARAWVRGGASGIARRSRHLCPPPASNPHPLFAVSPPCPLPSQVPWMKPGYDAILSANASANPAVHEWNLAPWMKPGYDAILSANASANPAVHEWNLVRVLYCDGGGYAGTKGRVKLTDGTSIYLDGWNVLRAVVQDLCANRGMDSPSHILLSGSSAGGQAVVNLCDWLAASFRNATTRCLVDSGFFMDAKDRVGKHGFRLVAQSITALHRPYNPYCAFAATSAQQWKCFFPQYTLRTIA